jgi:hypothetical protein
MMVATLVCAFAMVVLAQPAIQHPVSIDHPNDKSQAAAALTQPLSQFDGAGHFGNPESLETNPGMPLTPMEHHSPRRPLCRLLSVVRRLRAHVFWCTGNDTSKKVSAR